MRVHRILAIFAICLLALVFTTSCYTSVEEQAPIEVTESTLVQWFSKNQLPWVWHRLNWYRSQAKKHAAWYGPPISLWIWYQIKAWGKQHRSRYQCCNSVEWQMVAHPEAVNILYVCYQDTEENIVKYPHSLKWLSKRLFWRAQFGF